MGGFSMKRRLWRSLFCILWGLLIKFVVSNGLETFTMGKNRTLAGVRQKGDENGNEAGETHPVIVLFAVVIAGEVWGATGMLVSVPFLSIVRLYLNIARDKELERSKNRKDLNL